MVQKNKVRNTKKNVVKLLRKMEKESADCAITFDEMGDEIMAEALSSESDAYWRVIGILLEDDYFTRYWDLYMKEEN